MTQPTPAPKQPRPIRDDPKAGMIQVVVSFRVPAFQTYTVTQYQGVLERWLRRELPDNPTALYVTAYEIGAGGEKSEHEGTVGLTDDVPTYTVRDLKNIKPKDGML